MFCDNCFEHTDNFYKILESVFCKNCVTHFSLIKCPNKQCKKIISLNGYNDLYDIEDNTCSACNVVFCNECFVKSNNLKICKECFNKI